MSSFFPQGMTLKALLENPSLLNPSKQKKQDEDKIKAKDDDSIIDFGSAFLGPTLWDNTLPYDGNDFKLEYMDLDEFLSENGIPVNPASSPGASSPQPQINSPPSSPQQSQSPQGPYLSATAAPSPSRSVTSSPQLSPVCSPQKVDVVGPFHGIGQMSPTHQTESPCASPNMSPIHQSVDLSQMTPTQKSNSSWTEQQQSVDSSSDHDDSSEEKRKRVRKHSDSCDQVVTVPGQEGFDPKEHQFSLDELKPQPMIKKSRKVFVPEDLKDDKYWARRKKNNVAAKRSRDARRVKENQIAMRAAFLEDEHLKMKEMLEATQRENEILKEKLAKYEK